MDNVEDFNRAVFDFLDGLQEQNQGPPGAFQPPRRQILSGIMHNLV